MSEYVQKGWGYEIIITNTNMYCGKLLVFNKGSKCSWHYHQHKDETFYLQSGELLVRYSDTEDLNTEDEVDLNADHILLRPGMSFHVPPGRRHQMIALEDSELFEFSTEDFADDSYRIFKGD